MILDGYEKELESVDTSAQRNSWIVMVGKYFLIYFVYSLRSNEVFSVETPGLIIYILDGQHQDD